MSMRFILVLSLLIASYANGASISPRIYNALNELQQKINEQPSHKDVADINKELDELLEDLSGNSLGMALTYQTLSQLKVYEQKEKESQVYLEKALALKDLNVDTINQIRSMLAYSFFNSGEYSKAIEQLKLVIQSSEKQSANILALLAASYYSIEDFKTGLPYIERACDLTEKPKEGWLQMAFSGNYQIKKMDKALFYVNQLVYHFPEKKDYWQQKAGLHQILEDYENASATKELAYKKGFLDKESDFINLGQLLASQGEAYKVALALEKALASNLIPKTEKTLNLQFQSWLQAKEIVKARLSLAELFTMFKDADDGYQLLQYYIDGELWKEADTLAVELLELKLTDKQKGKVYLYHGMVKYNLGDTRQAMKLLGKSTAFESSSSQAKSWMSYIKQMSA